MKPKQVNQRYGLDALSLAAERGQRYAREIRERWVAPTEAQINELSKFHEAFPESSTDPRSVVAMLDELGSPATVATTGGRYFGFVTGGVLPASLAASWLASAWDQNAGLRVMSPVGVELEDVALSWICEALHLPANCEGGLVTGATTANFTALAAARYGLLKKAGWDVAEDGMFGAPAIEVVVGAEVGAAVLRGLSVGGVGGGRVWLVEREGQGV